MTDQPAPVKKKKHLSRSARWGEACANALGALQGMMDQLGELEESLSELEGLREEYEEWKDNLPENLAGSPLGEKLEEVCNLDLESITDNVRGALEEAQGTLEEADGMDLPRGFGRD